MMERLHNNPSKALLSTLLLLLLFWTTSASAQNERASSTQTPQPSVENGRTEEGMQGSTPVESPRRSRVEGWFNRSGSGLFIALTPFATVVTLLVLLLLILLPLLLGAAFRRKKRGYFKTVSYTRQRRYA
jgi:hypothetical protein